MHLKNHFGISIWLGGNLYLNVNHCVNFTKNSFYYGNSAHFSKIFLSDRGNILPVLFYFLNRKVCKSVKSLCVRKTVQFSDWRPTLLTGGTIVFLQWSLWIMTIKTILLHCLARWLGNKDIKAYGLYGIQNAKKAYKQMRRKYEHHFYLFIFLLPEQLVYAKWNFYKTFIKSTHKE